MIGVSIYLTFCYFHNVINADRVNSSTQSIRHLCSESPYRHAELSNLSGVASKIPYDTGQPLFLNPVLLETERIWCQTTLFLLQIFTPTFLLALDRSTVVSKRKWA